MRLGPEKTIKYCLSNNVPPIGHLIKPCLIKPCLISGIYLAVFLRNLLEILVTTKTVWWVIKKWANKETKNAIYIEIDVNQTNQLQHLCQYNSFVSDPFLLCLVNPTLIHKLLFQMEYWLFWQHFQCLLPWLVDNCSQTGFWCISKKSKSFLRQHHLEKQRILLFFVINHGFLSSTKFQNCD